MGRGLDLAAMEVGVAAMQQPAVSVTHGDRSVAARVTDQTVASARQVLAVLDEVVGRRAEADEILEQLELARRMRFGGVIHAQGLEAVCRQAVHGRQDATAAGILPTPGAPVRRWTSSVGADILGRLNRASPDPLAKHSLSPRELQAVLAAERAHEPFVVVRGGDGELRVIALAGDVRTLTIGRRAEMDIPIGWDAEVSGLHAELQAFSGEWTIVDDGLSTNGTYVNGSRVRGRQRLRDGDRVRVGKTLLVYRSVEAGARATHGSVRRAAVGWAAHRHPATPACRVVPSVPRRR